MEPDAPQKIKEQARQVIELGKQKGLTEDQIAKKTLEKVNYKLNDKIIKHNSKEFRALLLIHHLGGKKQGNEIIVNGSTLSVN